jgi:hypothetical protein
MVMVVLGMALYRGKDVWGMADKMQNANCVARTTSFSRA